jgi:hypothetical protein
MEKRGTKTIPKGSSTVLTIGSYSDLNWNNMFSSGNAKADRRVESHDVRTPAAFWVFRLAHMAGVVTRTGGAFSQISLSWHKVRERHDATPCRAFPYCAVKPRRGLVIIIIKGSVPVVEYVQLNLEGAEL